jgi:hypothetical protein
MSIRHPASVEAAMESGPTPPLKDFLEALARDNNLYWRIGHGHTNNLLDEAVEAIDRVRALHRKDPRYTGGCLACEQAMPCPTIRALDGGE